MSAELSRRVETVVSYPPLSELDDLQRRELHEALFEAATFEDLPGKWQAAILKAEHKRPTPGCSGSAGGQLLWSAAPRRGLILGCVTG